MNLKRIPFIGMARAAVLVAVLMTTLQATSADEGLTSVGAEQAAGDAVVTGCSHADEGQRTTGDRNGAETAATRNRRVNDRTILELSTDGPEVRVGQSVEIGDTIRINGREIGDLVRGAGRGPQGSRTYSRVTTVRATRPLDDAVRSLRIITRVGNIDVIPSDAGEMVIEAVVSADNRMAHLEQIGRRFDDHVHVARKGDVLTIADAHRHAEDREVWAVSLKLALPRTMAIDAGTAVGDIDIRLASGAVALKAGVGDLMLKADATDSVTTETGVGDTMLHLTKVAGKVSAKTGTGTVTLRVAGDGPEDEVTLTSGVGTVRLDLPPGAGGRFDMETGLGSVSVKGFKGVNVHRKTLGATASGRIGDRGPRYKLRTGTGSILATVRSSTEKAI